MSLRVRGSHFSTQTMNGCLIISPVCGNYVVIMPSSEHRCCIASMIREEIGFTVRSTGGLLCSALRTR